MDHDKIPYLIQRVSRREHTDESRKGIDRIFSFDYMGSSEFEFGSVPKALKEMRDAKTSKWKVQKITVGKDSCYFVGAPDMMDVAKALFEDEMKNDFIRRKYRHKEWTYMRETYYPPIDRTIGQYHAWWALDAKVPFWLFKDKKHAEELLALL